MLMERSQKLHPKSAIETSIIPRSNAGRGIINLQWLRNKQISNIKKYFHPNASGNS